MVEDDDAVRDSTRAVLESLGFDVSEYASAVDFLTAVSRPLGGCVLLDLHMPGMSGLELLELIRRRGWDLPAIIVTGRSDELLKARAGHAGIVTFLTKPIEEATLVQALDNAFSS